MNPTIFGVIGSGFLNQVPTLGFRSLGFRGLVGFSGVAEGPRGLGFRGLGFQFRE